MEAHWREMVAQDKAVELKQAKVRSEKTRLLRSPPEQEKELLAAAQSALKKTRVRKSHSGSKSKKKSKPPRSARQKIYKSETPLPRTTSSDMMYSVSSRPRTSARRRRTGKKMRLPTPPLMPPSVRIRRSGSVDLHIPSTLVDLDVVHKQSENASSSSGDDDQQQKRVEELIMSMTSLPLPNEANNIGNDDNDDGGEEDNQLVVPSSTSNLSEIEASVARLRRQRHAVARLKHSAAQKDETIAELARKNSELESMLAAARAKEAKVRKKLQEAKAETKATSRKIKEASETFKEREMQLMERINRSSSSQRDLAKLKKQCAAALEGAASYKDCVEKYRAELVRNKDAFNASKKKWAASRSKYKKQIAELQDACETIAASSTQWEGKAKAMEIINEEQRAVLAVKEDEIKSAADRCGILEDTIAELEESCSVLRTQLVSCEEEMKREARDVVGELKETKVELQRRSDECEDVKEELERCRRHLASIKETRRHAVEELENAARRNKSLQRQLEAAASDADALRKELDVERKEKRTVSSKRLDLLNKFYQEEMLMQTALLDPEVEVFGQSGILEDDPDEPWVNGRLSDVAFDE